MNNFFEKIRKKKQVIFYMTLIFASLSFLFATLIPPKYRSDIKVLIIQNNADAFSASKGVSYLSDVFIQVVHTETFFSDVLASPFKIENTFSDDPKKRKKQWEGEVKIKKFDDTGIFLVTVFDGSREQAEKIAGAIGWNFLENGKKYYGETKDVTVKIIDGPITTSSPAYPNVFLSAFLGGIAGLFSSLIIIFFYESSAVVEPKKTKDDKRMIEIQIKKQLKERKSRKELDYKEPSFDDLYDFSKREALKAGNSKVIDEAERSVKFEKITSKHGEENAKKEKRNSGKEPFVKGSLLNKLYGRSIFSDKKFADKAKESLEKDRLHQSKRDVYAEDISGSDNVRKITSENIEKIEKEGELRIWSPGGAKAPAPENLPVFLDEINQENAKEETEDKTFKRELSQENLQLQEKEFAQEEMSSEFPLKGEGIEERETRKEAQKSGNVSRIDLEREPTDEEVKEKLNKLLKGEL